MGDITKLIGGKLPPVDIIPVGSPCQELSCAGKRLSLADKRNGLFLGTLGSGKNFSAKREIMNVFLLTEDDIIISDSESDYFSIVKRLGGQVIRLSPVSPHHINPLDINPDYSDEEDPLTLKRGFILSLCELILDGKKGLRPMERTIIDRCPPCVLGIP